MLTLLKKRITETFFQTLEDLKTKEKLELFFVDFLSSIELEKFVNRLAIAYFLKKGRDNKNIKTNLKVSDSEINFIRSKLKTKGIQLAIKQIEAEEWANVWSEKIKKLGARN